LPPGTPDAVNGQIIGNMEIVPLHGGAGGASGGPNDSVGGGGGGALALYSATGALISSAEARGGDGKNGFNGALSGDPSGGGAGGGITIGGKRGVQIGTVNVSGGLHGTAAPSAAGAPVAGDGGIGRFRHDGRSAGGFSLTTGASSFIGPTTDTLTYADSMNWTIRGTGRYLPGTGGDSIYVFVRGENSGWNFAAPFRAIVGADSTWSARIALPYDSLAYICAVQRTPAADIATSTQATRVPSHIFSQSAANIVRLHLIPVIVAPLAHRMDTVTCPAVRYDTIPVRNTGTGLLIIGTGSGFVGPNGQFYKIISPTLPDTIRPDSTGSIVISFNGINAPAGTIGATLRLASNDPATPQKDIAIDIVKEPRLRALREKIIDMGDVFVGTSRDTIAVYRNLNSYRDTLNAIVPFFSIGPGTMVRTAPSLISIQKGLDSAIIGFTYTPVDTGRFEIRYRIYSDPCDQQDTLIIRGYARSPIISARKTWELTGLACGDTATGQFFVRNNGNAPLILQNPTITGPGAGNYTVIAPAASSFPLQVRAGDSVGITVRVIYAGAGTVPAAQLIFANNDGFRGKNPYAIDLFADKDPAGLSVTDSVLDFGVVCIGKDGFRTIGIRNDAQRATRTIISVAHSDPASPFSVVIPAEFPGDISPATTSDFSVRLDAARPGTFVDTISLLYQPCNRHIRLILRGEVVRAGLVLTPVNVEFGEVQIGKASRKTVIITNPNTPGGAPVTISSIAIVPASSSVTIIQPASPPA
ncbi:MAG: choice-of-anchor D domain-containing protein, partial [Candidatus Kapaibacterium sp.]